MSLSLCALRAVSRAASRLAQPALVRAVAPLPRLMAAVPVPAAAVSAPVRALHSSLIRRGGHGHDDGEFHHGTDFLSRSNVERRVKAVLAEVEKVDKSKLEDPNRSEADRTQRRPERPVAGGRSTGGEGERTGRQSRRHGAAPSVGDGQ